MPKTYYKHEAHIIKEFGSVNYLVTADKVEMKTSQASNKP